MLNDLHSEFWSLWRPLREKLPGKKGAELAAADHAAWMLFKALREPPKPKLPELRHHLTEFED